MDFVWFLLLLIFIGGEDEDMDYHDSIFEFDIVEHTWTVIGKMKHKRSGHAVSVVRSEDINYCEEFPPTTTTTTTTTTSVATTSTSTAPTTTTAVNPEDFGRFQFQI